MRHTVFIQSLAEAFLQEVAGKKQPSILEEVEAFQKIWQQTPVFRDALMGRVSLAGRLTVLRTITEKHLSITAQNLLAILLRQQALNDLAAFLDKARHLRIDRGLGREVTATVVKSLQTAERKHLQQSLEKMMTMPITLREQIDSEIIGGLRLDSRDWSWDATVQHRLQRLIQQLRVS